MSPRTGLLALFLPLAACTGAQSALDPAGAEAERLADLFWFMLVGAGIVWALVLGAVLYAVRVRPRAHEQRTATLLMLGGGVVLPTAVLLALLWYGLVLMRDLRTPATADVAVKVEGELWWWRVTYLLPDGRTVESANEVRLPRGERVRFDLVSDNVIHSFWVPSLGGKMDLIPGRVNELVLEATKTGTYRGQCAEYCGASHALMAFAAVVMEPEAFAAWLAREAGPAAPVAETAAGFEVFMTYGCGACHAIRGTEADGRIGPDLTHVGSRATLGAGILGNDVEAFQEWIAHTQALKPDVRMPSFGVIPRDELEALARYLEGLE